MEERYVKNGDLSESNEEYKKLCRDINFINKVLRKWNILLWTIIMLLIPVIIIFISYHRINDVIHTQLKLVPM